jgi:hypothetical protein
MTQPKKELKKSAATLVKKISFGTLGADQSFSPQHSQESTVSENFLHLLQTGMAGGCYHAASLSEEYRRLPFSKRSCPLIWASAVA